MVLCVALACAAAVHAEEEKDDAFVRLTIRGKAHYENRENDAAIKAFREALAARPDEPVARQNLALALMRVNDNEAAVRELEQVVERRPEQPAGRYLLGVCHKRLGRFDAAIASLERALALDAETVQVRYQLASSYRSAGRDEEAVAQLHEVVRRDPLFDSAFYQLAMYARRAGDRDAAQKYLLEMQRIRQVLDRGDLPPDFLELCHYTNPVVPIRPQPPSEPIPVRFVDVTEAATAGARIPSRTTQPAPRDAAAAVCILDVDGDGRWDILASWPGAGARLFRNAGDGRFEDRTKAAGLDALRWTAAVIIVGDFDNDGRTDAFISGPGGSALLHAQEDGTFRDVARSPTPAAQGVGCPLAEVRARDALWVDYDADGDLDLLVAEMDGGVRLFQNRGDRTFRDVTAEVGIPKFDAPVLRLAALDIALNDALDLVLAGPSRETPVLINQREGKYAPRERPLPWGGTVVAVEDVNNNGRIDVFIAGDDAARLGPINGPPRDLPPVASKVRDALFVDYDNDGWADLLLVRDNANRRGKPGGSLVLLRNEGDAGWRDVSADSDLVAVQRPVRRVAAADFDGDGDTDIIAVCDDGLLLLRNEGGHARRQLRINLEGTRSNRSALGARIEVRAGRLRVNRLVQRMPVEIGVAGHERLDSVQTIWTNGVVQHETDAAVVPGRPLAVKEKIVALGSCPYLYAWNGQRFEFITDLLGNAPLGLPAAPGVFLPADTDEYVYVGPVERFPPRDGRFVLRVTNELLEVLYLDRARLAVVDRPEDIEVHPTDKLLPPPFPESGLAGFRNVRPALSVRDDAGRDWTTHVRDIDGVFADPGEPLGPTRLGAVRPYSLEIDFGVIDTSRPTALIMTGWLQWGGASLNIALAKNPNARLVFSSLEALDEDGRWQPVDVIVGLPAGRTKTIFCDLTGRLPARTQRLRFGTSFETRWDRIALGEPIAGEGDAPAEPNTAPPPANMAAQGRGHATQPFRVTSLEPLTAELSWRGFSDIRASRPGHPTTPDHDDVSETPPWRRTLAGWCTRYGDVRKLLLATDDRYVIMNGGDALTLTFDASGLPPVDMAAEARGHATLRGLATPSGWRRELFFYSVGWDKDGNMYVREGETIGPLPYHGMDMQTYGDSLMQDGTRVPPVTPPEIDDWNLLYNTRFVPAKPFDETASR